MTTVTYGASLIEVPDQTVLLIDICEAFFDKAIADRLLRRGQAALRSASTQQIVVTLPYEPLPSMADTYELIVDWTGLEDLLASEEGEAEGAGTGVTSHVPETNKAAIHAEEPLLLALNQLGVAELLAEQSEDTSYTHPRGLPPCPTPLDQFGSHIYPFFVYNPFNSLRNIPGEGTAAKGQRYPASTLAASLSSVVSDQTRDNYHYNDTIPARWHSDGHANRPYAAHHQDYVGPNLIRHAQVQAASGGGPSQSIPYADDLDFMDVDSTTTIGSLDDNQDGQAQKRLAAFLAAVSGAGRESNSTLVTSVVFQKSGIYNKVSK